MSNWKINIEITAETFDQAKTSACVLLEKIRMAANWKGLRTCGGGPNGFSWDMRIESPIEAQIIELRREADELEKGLIVGEKLEKQLLGKS